ncbi:DUF4158 domain-containing protein [Ralstonia pseudosolanacearum]|nr:DUF4158 domain-containing protein [Ralstonia pseudosolanacearum]MDO3615293.1 DUF4158 domain-containing protein [Ralstonia pseudosolanacearum]
MATVERTAYPRFPKVFSAKELQACYTPSAEELDLAGRATRGRSSRLGLLVLLKVFQQLHYFPYLDTIPAAVVDHVRVCAGLDPDTPFGYDRTISPLLYRHYALVREYLGIQPYIGTDANEVTIRAAREAAETMDQPVDIINATIDTLLLQQIELPSFSTLDTIAGQIHARTQAALFRRVVRKLSEDERQRLDKLLVREFTNRQTAYNNIKRHARRPSRKHLNLLIEHLEWLDTFGDLSGVLDGVPATKLRSLANQAMGLDAANLKETLPEKRYTLIVALFNHMRVRSRDDLAEMFIRRMGAIHKRAKDELEYIQSRQRAKLEGLVTVLDGVVDIVADGGEDARIGAQIRKLLAPNGDLEPLRERCAEVRAFSGNNYLPLLWRHFRAHRSVMLRLARALEWESTSQSRTLLGALDVVLENESLHREWIAAEVDVSFASERWRKLVRRAHHLGPPTNRRYLELCVLSHMVNELRSGDLCVLGSDAFADYRAHLLPWRECERRLPEYCAKLDLPANAQDFVAHLKQWLIDTAQTLDKSFPDKRQHVTISADGEPMLKRTTARDIPPSAIALQQALVRRMPTVTFRRKGAGSFRPNGATGGGGILGSNGDQEWLFFPPLATVGLAGSGIGRGSRKLSPSSSTR